MTKEEKEVLLQILIENEIDEESAEKIIEQFLKIQESGE